MNDFNTHSRRSNALKTSLYGTICTVIRLFTSFVFRTFFVKFLSINYLGINGLFSNVLMILSLADLGIITAITYRFYDPISRGDTHYVGMLMNYFRRIYGIIALIITCLGLVTMPFIKLLISDSSEIPADINTYLVFGLFILNSVSSYIFSYKQTLLSADQKDYIVATINTIILIVQYAVQLLILLITGSYTLMLVLGIMVVIILNFVVSLGITARYPKVFAVKEMLPKDEQKKIFSDTKAAAYHRVGGVVLTGTDNVVLTKLVSLVATGIYANYSMITVGISTIIEKIVGNFSSIVGNALHTVTSDEYYKLFKKINFIALWVISVATVMTELFIDDFIVLWVGSKYRFDKTITVVLCLQLYIQNAKIANISFLNATGLFVKDRARPIIEAALNLVISIIMTYYYGIAGVFAGTIISMLVTVSWRQPFILYKHSFKKNIWEYWKEHLYFFCLTAAIIVLAEYLIHSIDLELDWINLVIKAGLTFILVNLILAVFNVRKLKWFIIERK